MLAVQDDLMRQIEAKKTNNIVSDNMNKVDYLMNKQLLDQLDSPRLPSKAVRKPY